MFTAVQARELIDSITYMTTFEELIAMATRLHVAQDVRDRWCRGYNRANTLGRKIEWREKTMTDLQSWIVRNSYNA